MSGFYWNVDASAGPAREGLVGGRAKLLVRVCLFNEPYDNDDLTNGAPTKHDAFTDLRTSAARDLAFELLAAAEHAEILTAHDHPGPER